MPRLATQAAAKHPTRESEGRATDRQEPPQRQNPPAGHVRACARACRERICTFAEAVATGRHNGVLQRRQAHWAPRPRRQLVRRVAGRLRGVRLRPLRAGSKVEAPAVLLRRQQCGRPAGCVGGARHLLTQEGARAVSSAAVAVARKKRRGAAPHAREAPSARRGQPRAAPASQLPVSRGADTRASCARAGRPRTSHCAPAACWSRPGRAGARRESRARDML